MPKYTDKNIKYFKNDALKKMMAAKGWNAKKLSDKSGLSAGLISNILSGKRQPRIDTGVILAKTLGVPINHLIKDLCFDLKTSLDSNFQEFFILLKKIIASEIEEKCKNCKIINTDVDYHEKIVILDKNDQELADKIRRSHGPDFEAGAEDVAAALNDNKEKRHNHNLPGQSEAG